MPIIPAQRARNARNVGWQVAVVGRIVALVVALAAAPNHAFAGVDVEGAADNLQVRAQNASIRELLDGLVKFNVVYRLPPDLNRSITGYYAGTLSQVLARVLDGHDYIVKVSDTRIEIFVLGVSGAAVVQPVPNPARPGSVPPPAAQAAVPTIKEPPPLASYR